MKLRNNIKFKNCNLMDQLKSNVNKSSNIQTSVYLLSLTHLSSFHLEHLELFLVSVKVNQYQTRRLRAAFLTQAIKTIYLILYDLLKKHKHILKSFLKSNIELNSTGIFFNLFVRCPCKGEFPLDQHV